MKPWFEARTLEEVRKALDEHGVCWGPYQTFTQLLDDDWRALGREPGLRQRRASRHRPVAHPDVAAALHGRIQRRAPARAPLLGTHTDEVLDEVLGLSSAEIGRLHDAGLVASAS